MILHTRLIPQLFCVGLFTAALSGVPSAQAANATWTGLAGTGVWATAGNWSASPAPTTGNAATFNGNGNSQTTVNFGVFGNLGGLVFDTANCASYTINADPGTPNSGIWFGGGWFLKVTSTVTHDQTINALINLPDSGGGIENDSLTATLYLGGIRSLYDSGNASLTFNAIGNIVVSGEISNPRDTPADNRGMVKNGGGTLTFTGTNTYLGATKVTAGTLKIGNGTSGSISGSSAVSVSTGAAIVFNEANGSTIANTIANSGTINATASGTNTFSNVISGTGSFTQTGAGTSILTGTNTYTGATTVSAGKLVVNGVLAAGSAVSVSSEASLGGSGTMGAVTVNGTLAPGNSIGTINTGNLTLGAISVLDVELGRDGTNAISDRTNVTGTVNITNGADLKLTLYSGLTAPQAGDLFFLIVNDSTDDAINGVFTSLNGSAKTLTEGSQFTWNNQQWEITYQANAEAATPSFTGGNDVAIMAVPEPATWSMIVGGFGMLIGCQKLRRRSSK